MNVSSAAASRSPTVDFNQVNVFHMFCCIICDWTLVLLSFMTYQNVGIDQVKKGVEYNRTDSYAVSKLMNVLFSKQIAR